MAANGPPLPAAPLPDDVRRPVHVQIKQRGCFRERVDDVRVGDTLHWAFFTGRKNIAFGLYYVLPPCADALEEDMMRSHAESAIAAARTAGDLAIEPRSRPKPGHGTPSAQSRSLTGTLSRQPSRGSVAGTGPLPPSASAPTGHLPLPAQHSPAAHPLYAAGAQLSSSDSALSAAQHARNAAASTASLPDMRTVDNGTRASQASSRDGLASLPSPAPGSEHHVELLPVERYESSESTVRGRLCAPLAGTYVLYFDNSYSISTPKELFLTVAVTRASSADAALRRSASLSADGAHFRPGQATAASTQQLLERQDEFGGWLLKRRGHRIQGWARRWFQLDASGRLSYYSDRFSPARGAVSVAHCTVTWIPPKLQITIVPAGGSSSETVHVRAESPEAYMRWSERINAVRARLAADEHGSLAAARSQPLPMPPAIASAMDGAVTALAQMRKAASDAGGDVPDTLIAPLERAFTALDALYGSLAEHISLMRTPHGREPDASSVAAARSAASADDEFYDAQDVVLFDVSDDERESLFSSSRGDTGTASPAPSVSSAASSLAAVYIGSASGSPTVRGSLPEFIAPSLMLSSEEDLSSLAAPSAAALPMSAVRLSDSSAARQSGASDETFVTAPGAPLSTAPAVTVESAETVPAPVDAVHTVSFREAMPTDAPENTVSLGGLLWRSIGRDPSTLSMPVLANEPLSVLQRLAEDLEYSVLLDRAAAPGRSRLDRMALIAAFAVSPYALWSSRLHRKPFTPMLGETFELVRPDRGMRMLAEKICHRPLVVACFAQGGLPASSLGVCPRSAPLAEPPQAAAWEFWQDQTMRNEGLSRHLVYAPEGHVHVWLREANAHYVWNRVTTTVRNMLGAASSRTVEHHGEMVIRAVGTADCARVHFLAPNETPRGGEPNQVTVTITLAPDAPGEPPMRAVLRGRWDRGLFNPAGQPVWLPEPLSPDAAKRWGFTRYAASLNDIAPYIACASGRGTACPGDGVRAHAHGTHCTGGVLAPTDSRLRHDQRLLERALVDDAEAEKIRVEQVQRKRRAALEASGQAHVPRWFVFCPRTSHGSAGTDHRRRRSIDDCDGDEDGAWRIADPEAYWAERSRCSWPSSHSLW